MKKEIETEFIKLKLGMVFALFIAAIYSLVDSIKNQPCATDFLKWDCINKILWSNYAVAGWVLLGVTIALTCCWFNKHQ